MNEPVPDTTQPKWLNSTVWGMAITSFLSDLGHEAQSTLLPGFMAALGLPPLALGAVEGIADAASSFMKLGAGWFSDRIGRRKGLIVGGYMATGAASGIMALAAGWPLILFGKFFGWLGRGIRGPLRNALLTDSVPAEARGRAFGFHRFGDTLGAILGPLAAVLLLAWGTSKGLPSLDLHRTLLAWTLVPGVLSGLAFAWLVKERARSKPKLLAFRHALSQMPTRFRAYLVSVGVFGAGDYSRTLLILAATQLLSPALGFAKAATWGGLLYVLHNVVYALATYPAGALADRFHNHRRILGMGYAVSVAVPLLLMVCFQRGQASLPMLALIFGLAGLVNGIQETLEAATTGDLAPADHRGLAFGLLGGVNGVGDLISSLVVGGLWTLHPTWGFGYAAVMMGAGAVLMLAKNK
ncbi:MAG: MFS transporter [Holophaga sp.]|nr:MFS transporter [Holophaga sp.]